MAKPCRSFNLRKRFFFCNSTASMNGQTFAVQPDTMVFPSVLASELAAWHRLFPSLHRFAYCNQTRGLPRCACSPPVLSGSLSDHRHESPNPQHADGQQATIYVVRVNVHAVDGSSLWSSHARTHGAQTPTPAFAHPPEHVHIHPLLAAQRSVLEAASRTPPGPSTLRQPAVGRIHWKHQHHLSQSRTQS